MQKVIFKFLLITTIVSVGTLKNLVGESTESELFRADSLYEKSQYTQAIKIYNNLFQQGYSSPNMLLKLARLTEGQDKYGLSIFYLEKYYQLTADGNAIDHIEKLAETHALKGFDYDFSFFLHLYYQSYKLPITILLVFLSFGAILWIYFKEKDKIIPKSLALMILIVLMLTGFLNNYDGHQYAIVFDQPCYAMKGPSAGADVLQVLESPVKIKILKSVDVWSEVALEDRDFYIKTDQLKKL